MWQVTCYRVLEQQATFSQHGTNTLLHFQPQAYLKSGVDYLLSRRRLPGEFGFTVAM